MRKTLSLALVLVLTLAPGVSVRGQGGDARALVEQAIKAQGGDALAKARTAIRTGKGAMSFGKPVPFTVEMAMRLPDKMRGKFQLEAGTQKLNLIVVVNGDRGWRTSGGAADDLTRAEWEELHEEAYITWLQTLIPLRDKAFQLAPLPEIKINGKPAAGVKVSHQGRVDVELYFDKDTHLLVKQSRKTKEAGRPVTKENLFSEHKDFDGLKLPAKVIEFVDGRKRAELTVTGYKFPATVDDAEFAKP